MNDLKVIDREKVFFSFDIKLFTKEFCKKTFFKIFVTGGAGTIG